MVINSCEYVFQGKLVYDVEFTYRGGLARSWNHPGEAIEIEIQDFECIDIRDEEGVSIQPNVEKRQAANKFARHNLLEDMEEACSGTVAQLG